MTEWRTVPFQMFTGGPVWVPPNTTVKAKEEPGKAKLFATTPASDKSKDKKQDNQKHLANFLRDEFEQLLRELTVERQKIKDAMAFALDHADVSQDVVQIITESLTLSETPIPSKVARLFLVSDILHNSSARVPNASSYRNWFESKLPLIFENLHHTYKHTSGRITAENLKEQILRLLRIWEGWSLYPQSLVNQLHNIFLGISFVQKEQKEATQTEGTILIAEEEDIDGVPLDNGVIL